MKFYKNRATKYHPSIEIKSDERKWQNMPITHNPTKKKGFIVLKNNPNPGDTRPTYVKKYVRNDPIRTRGELLKKYKLSEDDLKQIEKFLTNKKR